MVLLWNKRMMDDEPASGNDPEFAPELYENQKMIIDIAKEEQGGPTGGAYSLNVINTFSDKGYIGMPMAKPETYHDFTPSFLTQNEENLSPDEPLNPRPSDPEINV